jgi:hypothetical protein
MGKQLKRLYEEKLVKDIMISTAFCVKDILQDDQNLTDDDIYEFIEANYQNVIKDTIEAAEAEESEEQEADEEVEAGKNGLNLENSDNLENPDADEDNGGFNDQGDADDTDNLK